MSETFLKRFFVTAKKNPGSIALSMATESGYHRLSYGYVRFKIKHFALGLLALGAKKGQYFYSYPGIHPYGIFSELGALSVGLQVIPVPQNLTTNHYLQLFEKFPPHFAWWEEFPFPSLEPFKGFLENSLALIQAHQQDFVGSTSLSQFTFPEIFNLGIRKESALYRDYRKIWKELAPQDIIRPIRWNRSQSFENVPMTHHDLESLAKDWLPKDKTAKYQRAFFQMGDPGSWDRTLAFYWAWGSGRSTYLMDPQKEIKPQLRKVKPEILFLNQDTLDKWFRSPLFPKPRPKGNPFGVWNRLLWGRRVKRMLGGQGSVLLSVHPLPKSYESILNAAKLNCYALPAPMVPNT